MTVPEQYTNNTSIKRRFVYWNTGNKRPRCRLSTRDRVVAFSGLIGVKANRDKNQVSVKNT